MGDGEEMISFTNQKPSVSTIDVTGIVVSVSNRNSSENGGKKVVDDREYLARDLENDDEIQSLNPK
jgi:hypothetical protein